MVVKRAIIIFGLVHEKKKYVAQFEHASTVLAQQVKKTHKYVFETLQIYIIVTV